MYLKYRNSEGGQASVLLAFAFIALLGFTALAIDGGMIYSNRRHAQNGSDASSLAGGSRLCTATPREADDRAPSTWGFGVDRKDCIPSAQYSDRPSA